MVQKWRDVVYFAGTYSWTRLQWLVRCLFCRYIQLNSAAVTSALSQCGTAVSTQYTNIVSTLFTQYQVDTTCGADPCVVNPCLYGGTCRRIGHSFQCTCQPGFTGDICQKGQFHFSVCTFVHLPCLRVDSYWRFISQFLDIDELGWTVA